MPSVRLPQGTFNGGLGHGIVYFHNIPYAAPFHRFQAPTLAEDDPTPTERDATVWGPNHPQNRSRLESVMGPLPADARYDEQLCGVLSVYSPHSNERAPPRAVIVWIHGGAFASGGSQLELYNGSRLAHDGQVVVVCINYRLGLFGFLLHGEHSVRGPDLPCGTADVLTALQWVQKNIHAFEGDPSNVTVMGQSAGGYHIQTLFGLSQAEELFHRAVIQSSPAAEVISLTEAHAIKDSLQEANGYKSPIETMTTQDLLAAESFVVAQHKDLWLPFCPASASSIAPAMQTAGFLSSSKDVLIGWTRDDGLCFARMRSPTLPSQQLDQTLTRQLFKMPARALAETLRQHGHTVTTFELNWAPSGFELGATHCTDLPLLFGDQKAWEAAPMLGTESWAEWERRGQRHRTALGAFAREGVIPQGHDGMEVHGPQTN